MSAQTQFWTLIVTLAIGTWLMRSLPIMLHGHVPHPPWLERFLKHVPVAALTALVVPGALYVHSGSTYTIAPARMVAAGARAGRGSAHEERAGDPGGRDGRALARPVGPLGARLVPRGLVAGRP